VPERKGEIKLQRVMETISTRKLIQLARFCPWEELETYGHELARRHPIMERKLSEIWQARTPQVEYVDDFRLVRTGREYGWVRGKKLKIPENGEVKVLTMRETPELEYTLTFQDNCTDLTMTMRSTPGHMELLKFENRGNNSFRLAAETIRIKKDVPLRVLWANLLDRPWDVE
jgi:hypothetical protein